MTTFEILNRWAKFTEYDANQNKFNLISSDYIYNRACKNIESLSKGYDPNGVVSSIYAKSVFTSVLKSLKLSVYNVITNKNGLADIENMWEIFNSQCMLDIENSFLDTINSIILKITGKRMLTGNIEETDTDEINGELLNLIFDSVEIVTEELTKCNEDLFKRSGKEIGHITKFSTHIHLFNTLGECLLAIDNAVDGIYLCYIMCNNTSNGYFGFMIKGNGNVIFINERVNEAYAGQHLFSRNARWVENKKLNLFPYKFIIDGAEHDYKGYATKQFIDDEKLDFINLGESAFIPLILAMVLLNNRYSTLDLKDKNLMYTDSLMEVNLKADTSTELSVISKNEIVVRHKEFEPGFTLEEVISGKVAERFDYEHNKDSGKEDLGIFNNCNQLMVDIWGQGFKYDSTATLKKLPVTIQIGSKENIAEAAEFIGSNERMQLEAFRKVRLQLASYIRESIYTEYVKFGGIKGIIDWYKEGISERLPVLGMLAAKATAIKDKTVSFEPKDVKSLKAFTEDSSRVSISQDVRYPIFGNTNYDYAKDIINKETIKEGKRTQKYSCFITGATCSIFVKLSPKNWRDIELLLGKEVPKLLKGWQLDRRTYGNPLLTCTDPISQVGTPVEIMERQFGGRQYYGYDGKSIELFGNTELAPGYNFGIVIGFSKRGLKELLKQ